jgi:hypothetical protein
MKQSLIEVDYSRPARDRKYVDKRHTLTLARSANTIPHEITHALLPPKTDHSRARRELAIFIGCDGERLHSRALDSGGSCNRLLQQAVT